MNQALLSGIASKAYDKLLKATESKQPIAVTGLPDTMAAYIASKLCADTGKKVLLISGNDLKAAHDAEDGQQRVPEHARGNPIIASGIVARC